MAFINPQGTVFARWHGAGIVFRRHTYEWVLPAMYGPHLKYDPRKLPKILIGELPICRRTLMALVPPSPSK